MHVEWILEVCNVLQSGSVIKRPVSDADLDFLLFVPLGPRYRYTHLHLSSRFLTDRRRIEEDATFGIFHGQWKVRSLMVSWGAWLTYSVGVRPITDLF